jgi:hypothetical protein
LETGCQFTYNDDASTFMIKQLNFTYEFSDALKVIVGVLALILDMSWLMQ